MGRRTAAIPGLKNEAPKYPAYQGPEFRSSLRGENGMLARKHSNRLSLTNMRLTDKEKAELWGMRFVFDNADVNQAVGNFAQGITDLLESGHPDNVHRAIAGIEQVKSWFQQMHNFYHTLGMIAAKAFLEVEFPNVPWENIEFAQDANRSGADLCIEEYRIVAELKTTEPCGKSKTGTAPVKFGAQQKQSIDKDLQKLDDVAYSGFRKYMFVTSPLAYLCLVRDHRIKFPTITFVLLRNIPDVSRPDSKVD